MAGVIAVHVGKNKSSEIFLKLLIKSFYLNSVNFKF